MRPRDESKIQSIRQLAVEMISKEGLEGFGINKLAKAAGVSPATIYIYYKDKDDLIISISQEEGRRMSQAILKGFDPSMSFEEGLWIQWKNRSKYMLHHKKCSAFYEQLGNSAYREKMTDTIALEFKKVMAAFVDNAIQRGEIEPMPLEVYWCIAFAPLYSLTRFHNEGRSIGGNKFALSEKIMKMTFDRVVKALKK